MADSKKYNGSTWEHSLRKLITATDTITALPADLYADGTNATVGLVGNMSQTGTPTPQNPIQPSETGDKTANLFIQKLTGATIDSTGKITSDANYDTYIAEVSDGETYTVSNATGIQVFGFFTTIPTLSTITYNSSRTIFSTPSQTLTVPTGENIKYIGVRYNTGVSNEMLNTGSTALPYEPYGYKIPISSAGTTTPVYLGEVETTRKIEKVVFTGSADETWNGDSLDNKMRYYPTPMITNGVPLTEAISTHFAFGGFNANSGANGTITGTNSSSAYRMYFWSSDYATVDAWKSYLAQQYSAGTPVCVWYVLANEETGIVNEPIRKIGDYADTVSGITIPTIAGANSFDVLTTLKPSEVSLAYTGWHDATVEEWDGSQWQ